jgi:TrmH family RNA methyltransferase
MLSKNQIKLITSLQHKKYRLQHQLFIAEGIKVIDELLDAEYVLHQLFVTNSSLFTQVLSIKKHLVSDAEMQKISCLATPSSCLAVFEIPAEKPMLTNGLVLALDNVRDPGNFGTIIRLCDWYGVYQIVCSKETVDLYNPKVVMATMGSIARVQVSYIDLENYLQNTNLPIYGTFMDGKNVYQQQLPVQGILVMGNEANGISKNIERLVTHKIAIPRFGTHQKTESLNVASATAIFLSEFKRNC